MSILNIYHPIWVYIQDLLNILQTSEKENIAKRQLRLHQDVCVAFKEYNARESDNKKKFEERKEMNETNVERGMSGSMCMFQGKKSIEA